MRSPKTVILLAAIILLAFSFAGCAQDQAAPPPAGNGGTQVLQGEAIGYNADVPIKVEVTLDGGVIKEITVLEHGETAGLSDPAFEKIPAAIIAAQSTNVDVVTNATATSKGIMQAVADAIN
jgi:uncharacterized protein with FMN-binding domain